MGAICAPEYDSLKFNQLKEMKAAFGAMLLSVPRKVQEEILHEWIPDLIASTRWDPWFREWMDKAFTVQNEHTRSQKQEVRSTSSQNSAVMVCTEKSKQVLFLFKHS